MKYNRNGADSESMPKPFCPESGDALFEMKFAVRLLSHLGAFDYASENKGSPLLPLTRFLGLSNKMEHETRVRFLEVLRQALHEIIAEQSTQTRRDGWLEQELDIEDSESIHATAPTTEHTWIADMMKGKLGQKRLRLKEFSRRNDAPTQRQRLWFSKTRMATVCHEDEL
mgnify:CR=1 FL=1